MPTLLQATGGDSKAASRRSMSPELGSLFNPVARDVRKSFKRDSAIERIGQNVSVNSFIAWINTKLRGWELLNEFFVQENLSPAGGHYDDKSAKGSRGIPRSRWISNLASLGFRDAKMSGDVFDEVVREGGEGNWKPDLDGAKAEPIIYQPQLKRFELRANAINSTLLATMTNSPARRFVEFIRHRNANSTIRAWAIEVDLRKTGRVAQNDFSNVCRRLGFSPQARLIWENMRPDKQTPLEVHDLDAREAENMEEYCDALWNGLGFDLDKVWSYMDPNSQMYVSKEDFIAAAGTLGFKGDAELIYRGLNISGVKRGVTKDEFVYLRKISRLAQRRLGGLQQGHNSISELITWVQRELGGAHELLVKLGVGGIGNAASILVSDLAARLTALGFEGDSLGAATRAARLEGGCVVSADALYALLSGTRQNYGTEGERPQSLSNPARDTTPTKRTKVTVSLHVLDHRQGWDNGVNDIVAANSQKCFMTRSYFDRSLTPPRARSSTPRKGDGILADPTTPRARTPLAKATNGSNVRNVTPTRRDASPRRPVETRPQWAGGVDGQLQDANLTMGAHTRKYFSDPFEKPVRAEIRRKLEARTAKRAAEQGGGQKDAWQQQTIRPEDLASY